MIYGYWRVSTTEQNEARQLKAFEECGEKIDKIFGDKLTGKNFDRPQYKKMVDMLAEGDLLIIGDIDRLGRNYDEIQQQWQIITKEKKADIIVLGMPLLNTRGRDDDLTGMFIADLVLKILSYVAEVERKNTKKRQAEGIAAMPVVDGRKVSTKTGRGFGRAAKHPKNFKEVYEKQQRGEISLKEGLQLVGVGRTRWYELAKEV